MVVKVEAALKAIDGGVGQVIFWTPAWASSPWRWQERGHASACRVRVVRWHFGCCLRAATRSAASQR